MAGPTSGGCQGASTRDCCPACVVHGWWPCWPASLCDPAHVSPSTPALHRPLPSSELGALLGAQLISQSLTPAPLYLGQGAGQGARERSCFVLPSSEPAFSAMSRPIGWCSFNQTIISFRKGPVRTRLKVSQRRRRPREWGQRRVAVTLWGWRCLDNDIKAVSADHPVKPGTLPHVLILGLGPQSCTDVF